MITQDLSLDGRRIFTYSDGRFPYAIQFIWVEETETDDGALLVLALRRTRGR